MKLLFLFCVCITLSAALPQRRIYKNYSPRKMLRQADGGVNVTTTTTTVAPAPVQPSTTAAESDEEGQTEGPAAQELVFSANATTTVEPEAENKPIAEPTKAPAQAAAPVPSSAAVTPSPVNQTVPEEEDDSSSEEEEAEAKQLPVVRLEAPRRQNNKKSRDTKDPNPKFAGVIRGYMSESGELLVPISAFPGNFHYSIVHDDKVEVNAEDAVPASSSEENVEDAETQSEEVVAVKKGAGAAVNETEPSSGSEEVKPDTSSSVEEAEDKVVSSESAEKEKPAEPVPVKETPTSIFNPPPLAALPATKPTDEDDEEEAGGRRLVPILPPGPGGYYIPNVYNFNPYYDEDDYDF